MRCKTCHYPLTGLTGPPHRCPECGRAFDPNVASTVDWAAITLRRRALRLYILIQITFGALLLAVTYACNNYLAHGWKLTLLNLAVPVLLLATLIGPIVLTRAITRNWYGRSP